MTDDKKIVSSAPTLQPVMQPPLVSTSIIPADSQNSDVARKTGKWSREENIKFVESIFFFVKF